MDGGKNPRRNRCGSGGYVIVTVNDERVQVDEHTTVAALLSRLGFPDRGVAVAVDWSVLPRSGWNTTLSDGARLEVVTAVQGG
jgi:sulfur carrier protein